MAIILMVMVGGCIIVPFKYVWFLVHQLYFNKTVKKIKHKNKNRPRSNPMGFARGYLCRWVEGETEL